MSYGATSERRVWVEEELSVDAVDQTQSLRRTQNEDRSRERVCQFGVRADDGHASSVVNRIARSEIENVRISSSVDQRETLIVARRHDRQIGDPKMREGLFRLTRIRNADETSLAILASTEDAQVTSRRHSRWEPERPSLHLSANTRRTSGNRGVPWSSQTATA